MDLLAAFLGLGLGGSLHTSHYQSSAVITSSTPEAREENHTFLALGIFVFCGPQVINKFERFYSQLALVSTSTLMQPKPEGGTAY